jgi:dTDP-4-dehydrorhamnose 3,5-epimerase
VKFHPTPIAGVMLIEPRVIGDARGYFKETWQSAIFKQAGIEAAFVQDNESRSNQWTLRGMHTQIEHAQGKLVRVTAGTVFDVVVDLRLSSPSYGQWWAVELSDRNHHMLWVPPGLAHGVLVTSPSADLVYKCTDFYSPGHERTLAWDDPTVAIAWPLPGNMRPKLSSKDELGLSFDAIEKFA